MDLMLAVRSLGGGDVIDLGCGNGAMGAGLKERFAGRRIVGVDASPAMLAKARESGAYDALSEADIAGWGTERAGLIFSNAALHWLKEHEALFPRLADMLAPGGTLAVQMPHQNNAPSHRVWLSLVEEMFPGRVDLEAGPGVMKPARYHRLLAGRGAFALWETEYYQLLGADAAGHPVRRFTESTFARPILDALEPDEQAALIARYEDVMEKAYPRGADGTVLFPFRRMFFTLTV
jgi:trans-aconitate 2-methyltransferase